MKPIILFVELQLVLVGVLMLIGLGWHATSVQPGTGGGVMTAICVFGLIVAMTFSVIAGMWIREEWKDPQ